MAVKYQVVWNDGGGQNRQTKGFETIDEADRMARQLASDGMNVVKIKETENG